MKLILTVVGFALAMATTLNGQDMPAAGETPAVDMNGEAPAVGAPTDSPVLNTPVLNPPLGAPGQTGAANTGIQTSAQAPVQNQGSAGICNVGGVDLQNIFHRCKVTGIEYQGMFALLQCQDSYGNPVTRDVKIGDHLAFYMFAMGKGYEMSCVTVGADNHLATGRIVAPDATP